ncbi:hypothetical protein C9426_18655 [Serratia sp. S1B]|nr:hypothetical protein C9426_18655 [Serratia sp. S1B]
MFKSVPDRFISALPPSCNSNYLVYTTRMELVGITTRFSNRMTPSLTVSALASIVADQTSDRVCPSCFLLAFLLFYLLPGSFHLFQRRFLQG